MSDGRQIADFSGKSLLRQTFSNLSSYVDESMRTRITSIIGLEKDYLDPVIESIESILGSKDDSVQANKRVMADFTATHKSSK